MITQLKQKYNLSPLLQTALVDLHPIDRISWESYAARGIVQEIGIQLREFQNGKCCYCGLKYDETGRSEIEHIAPRKARPAEYPQFSFHPLNLAISCQLCNSPNMKGQYNSIDVLADKYDNCTFRIVHPYLDNPIRHYKWSHGLLGVLVIGLSAKANESIRLFKLASEHRTTARAKQRNHEILINTYNISQLTLTKIKLAISFIPK